MPSCFKSHTHDCSFSVSICNVAGRFVLFAESCNLYQEINTPSGTMAKKQKNKKMYIIMPTHILSPSLPPLPFLSCYKAATLPCLYTYTFNYNNNDIVLYFYLLYFTFSNTFCINTSFTHYIYTLLC